MESEANVLKNYLDDLLRDASSPDIPFTLDTVSNVYHHNDAHWYGQQQNSSWKSCMTPNTQQQQQQSYNDIDYQSELYNPYSNCYYMDDMNSSPNVPDNQYFNLSQPLTSTMKEAHSSFVPSISLPVTPNTPYLPLFSPNPFKTDGGSSTLSTPMSPLCTQFLSPSIAAQLMSPFQQNQPESYKINTKVKENDEKQMESKPEKYRNRHKMQIDMLEKELAEMKAKNLEREKLLEEKKSEIVYIARQLSYHKCEMSADEHSSTKEQVKNILRTLTSGKK